MFENIGKKIMTLAEVVTWLGIVGSIIYGFVIMAQDEDLLLAGLLTIILGSLGAWIGSFLLYGFGQLIENTEEIIRFMKSSPTVVYRDRYIHGENGSEEDEEDEDGDEEEQDEDDSLGAAPPTPSSYIPPIDVSSVHFWRCSGCGKTITTDICPFCGESSLTASHIFQNEEDAPEEEPVLSDEDAITNAYLSHEDANELREIVQNDDIDQIDDFDEVDFDESDQISDSVKICRECGAILNEDCLFCIYCGQKL